jgi:hypothetical protein
MSDEVLYQSEPGAPRKVIRKPDWANDPKLALTEKDVEKFNSTEFSMPERMEFSGNVLKEATIVLRGEGDIIYQFFGVKHPDFKGFLAEVVDEHFGSTDDFRVDYIQELKSWSLLAKDVRTRPLFNFKHYTEDFMWLLDAALEEFKKE